LFPQRVQCDGTHAFGALLELDELDELDECPPPDDAEAVFLRTLDAGSA
jgi:hypothetical protein